MNTEFKQLKSQLQKLIFIDENSLALSYDFLNYKTIPKGEYLVQEGQHYSKLTFVSKGIFRHFVRKDGNEITTGFSLENSFIIIPGSLMNKVLSDTNIRALENSIVLTISNSDLLRLAETNFNWQMIILNLLDKEHYKLHERLYSMNFDTAATRYKKTIKECPDLLKRVSILHLSSYVGVSRETLSRIRSKLDNFHF